MTTKLPKITLTLEDGAELTGDFVDMRLLKKDLHNAYVYDIRHSDDDMSVPATLEHSVTVNYFGSIGTSKEIRFPQQGYGGSHFLRITDWSFDSDVVL